MDPCRAMDREFDVIIFGASGFFGKHTVYHAVKILKGLKWAVAGKSRSKLKATLVEMGRKADTDLLGTIPIVEADIGKVESMVAMARRCRIVADCCVPLRIYGETVIRACVIASTHHVDVSGEPYYMERIDLKYRPAARKKGVYLVSACGLDSIPTDIGVLYLEKNFKGTVNSVEVYFDINAVDPKRKYQGSSPINYQVWETTVLGLSTAEELSRVRKALYRKTVPLLVPKPICPLLHRSRLIDNRWCLPFLNSDRSVVMRSQRYLYHKTGKRPILVNSYFASSSFGSTFSILCGAMMFGAFARFDFTKALLLKYPEVFSFGVVSRKGPSQEEMKNTAFSITIEGRGWAPGEDKTNKPRKTMVTRVSGVDPGYGATCVTLLVAVRTILEQPKSLPIDGGVYTPGAMFAKTNIIDDLCKNGLKFEVLSQKDK